MCGCHINRSILFRSKAMIIQCWARWTEVQAKVFHFGKGKRSNKIAWRQIDATVREGLEICQSEGHRGAALVSLAQIGLFRDYGTSLESSKINALMCTLE